MRQSRLKTGRFKWLTRTAVALSVGLSVPAFADEIAPPTNVVDASIVPIVTSAEGYFAEEAVDSAPFRPLIFERVDSTAASVLHPAAPINIVGGVNQAAPSLGAGVDTTGDLLEQAPSVNLRRTSALTIDPRIRGFNASQVNASVNGMPFYKTRIDIDSIVSQVPPGLIHSATVIDGPYSSLYGPGFSFIVMDLLPNQFFDGPEFHARTTFTQDTNARTFYNRDTVWGGNRDWSFVSSYGLRTANDYYSGAGYQVPSQFQTWDGFFSTSVLLTERTKFDFSYLHPETNGLRLPGVAYDISNQRSQFVNARFAILDDAGGPDRLVAQGWWGYTRYTGNSLNSDKATSFTQPFLNAPFGIPPAVGLYNTVYTNGSMNERGARVLATFGDSDGTLVTAGVDYRAFEMAYAESDFSNFPALFGVGSAFGIPRSTSDDFGLLFNVTSNVNESIVVTTGGRLDSYSVNHAATSLTGGAVTTPVPTGSGGLAQISNQPAYLLGMLYGNSKLWLTENINVTAGSAFSMRGPNQSELYSASQLQPIARFGNSYVTGNSNLNAENLIQFDLGLNGNWEAFNFGARSFYASIDNYIQAANVVSSPGGGSFSYGRAVDNNAPIDDQASIGYQYVNLSWADIYGGDMFAEANVVPWLLVGGLVNYQKGTNHDTRFWAPGAATQSGLAQVGSKGSAEGLLGIFPLNGAVYFRLVDPVLNSNRWALELRTRMVSGQNFVARSQGEVPSLGYTVCDLGGFWQVTDNLRLTSSILNLFNRNYTDVGSLAIVNTAIANPFGFVLNPGLTATFGAEYSY